MTRIILESKNKSDVLLITELADRLKIKYKIETRASVIKTKKIETKTANSLLDKGVDISNYGDPSEWQRNVRKDRSLKPA